MNQNTLFDLDPIKENVTVLNWECSGKTLYGHTHPAFPLEFFAWIVLILAYESKFSISFRSIKKKQVSVLNWEGSANTLCGHLPSNFSSWTYVFIV